jgi:hypothetical protein
VTPDSGWPARFEAELVRLGLQRVRAQQLTDETAQQAAESATPPGQLFGPAHLYARHLVTELNHIGRWPHPVTATNPARNRAASCYGLPTSASGIGAVPSSPGRI